LKTPHLKHQSPPTSLPPSILRAVALSTLLTAGLATLTSCASNPGEGYSFNSTFRDDVKSVSVPIFVNNTFYPGVEVQLAEAIVSEMRIKSPYAVTSSADAQTILTGTITNIERQSLTTGRQTGMSEDIALKITIDFVWKDQRSGKILTARRNFSASRSFIPASGVGETVAIGQAAAIQQLARDLVAELRSGW
jgi:hypothetical protein